MFYPLKANRSIFPELFNKREFLLRENAAMCVPRGCTRDEGRSLEASLQEQASNHLKLHW